MRLHFFYSLEIDTALKPCQVIQVFMIEIAVTTQYRFYVIEVRILAILSWEALVYLELICQSRPLNQADNGSPVLPFICSSLHKYTKLPSNPTFALKTSLGTPGMPLAMNTQACAWPLASTDIGLPPFARDRVEATCCGRVGAPLIPESSSLSSPCSAA